MQHLGAEDQMAQTLQDLLALLPPKDRLKGLSLEERLEGLSSEELERLRQLLHTEKKPENSSSPS